MTGKEKCELMKSIRKSIAGMNGIDYFPEQCDHKGNCPGFCPQCDAEAKWLMQELKRKEAAGSPIRIDTQSISSLEALANTPVDDDEEYESRLSGYVERPKEKSRPKNEPSRLVGEIAPFYDSPELEADPIGDSGEGKEDKE